MRFLLELAVVELLVEEITEEVLAEFLEDNLASFCCFLRILVQDGSRHIRFPALPDFDVKAWQQIQHVTVGMGGELAFSLSCEDS